MRATNKGQGTPMKRKARLTIAENKAWEFAFAFHVDNGMSDKRADALAWKDLCAEFTRLRKFQGCR